MFVPENALQYVFSLGAGERRVDATTLCITRHPSAKAGASAHGTAGTALCSLCEVLPGSGAQPCWFWLKSKCRLKVFIQVTLCVAKLCGVLLFWFGFCF